MPKSPRRRRFSASGEDRRLPPAQFNHEPASAQGTSTDLADPSDEADWKPSEEDEAHPTAEETSADPASTASDELLPAFRLVKKPRPRRFNRRRFTPFVLVGIAVGCLALGGLAGFALSRATQELPPPKSPAPNSPPLRLLTSDDQSELDAAYLARHQGKLAEAEKLFVALAGRDPALASLEVEVGRTLIYANQGPTAAATLQAALGKGYKPAETHLLLALLYKRQQSYALAEANFAEAVSLDPTQPDYYYFWGECLREQGKLVQATPKFRSALLRNQYETATGLYRLKLWLCEIEAGQADKDDTNAEIAAALALPLPPMEAFFATAARDLQNGDTPAAVNHLRSARQRADPTVFLVTMTDPVFAPIRVQSEFAEFFRLIPSPPTALGSKTDFSSPSPSGNTPSVAPTKTAPVSPKPVP